LKIENTAIFVAPNEAAGRGKSGSVAKSMTGQRKDTYTHLPFAGGAIKVRHHLVGRPQRRRSTFKGFFIFRIMNNFSISLDRYLTTPPDDGFDSWIESVCDGLSNEFSEWDNAADNAPSFSDEFTKMCYTFFSAGLTPGQASLILNQSFLFFDEFLRINDNDPQFDPKNYIGPLKHK